MESIKIGFRFLKSDQKPELYREELWRYLACLYLNGQILKSYSLVSRPGGFDAYATIPAPDALEPASHSVYGKSMRAKLQNSFALSVEGLGRNEDCGEPCGCGSPSCYLLYPEYGSEESPLRCGDCGGSIPLYKVPYIFGEEEHNSLLHWFEAYRAIDKLWMHGTSDRFSYRQLNHPDSSLFREGRKICRALETALHKPVYHFVFHAGKDQPVCPSCQQPWQSFGDQEVMDYKCDNCRLATEKNRCP